MFVLACVHTANARGGASPTSLQNRTEADLELVTQMNSNHQLRQERIPECITEHAGRYLPTPTGFIISAGEAGARDGCIVDGVADGGGEQPRRAEDK